MNLLIDHKIRNKYSKGFNRPVPPEEIIIHATAGGGTYKWMLMGSRRKLYERGIGLFHYLIQRIKDRVIEIIDTDKWVYHSSSGKHDKYTIGIEIVNPSPFNLIPPTKRQYKDLFTLIDLLLEKYPSISIIRSHKRTKMIYSGKPKRCPGKFDWEKLSDHLGRYWIKEHEDSYKKMPIQDIIVEELGL